LGDVEFYLGRVSLVEEVEISENVIIFFSAVKG
jgi:hypothetical protein